MFLTFINLLVCSIITKIEQMAATFFIPVQFILQRISESFMSIITNLYGTEIGDDDT
jgi:hypothetical protein